MNENQRTLLEECCTQLESGYHVIWEPEAREDIAATIRALLKECDEAKKKTIDKYEPIMKKISELDGEK